VREVFRAALVDYNGVLVDDELVHLAAFRDVLGPLGVQITELDYWERYLGFDDVEAFRAMLTDAGAPPSEERVRALVAAKRPLYLARAERDLRPFDGAADVLQKLAKFGPVIIVSGALREEIELGLRVLGVSDAVSHIVSAEDANASKPDPEGYLLGAVWVRKLLGEKAAERALVIEDSLSGIRAAKAAALTCLAVAHSYQPVELERAGADGVVDRIADVSMPLLQELYRKKYG